MPSISVLFILHPTIQNEDNTEFIYVTAAVEKLGYTHLHIETRH